MKMSKSAVLGAIRDVQLAEFLMYSSGVISPIIHANLCGVFQHLERLAEKSTLSEFEGEL